MNREKNVRLLIVAITAIIIAVVWAPRSILSYPTEQAVDQSAKFAGRNSEVCVTNSAGGTAVPTTGFTNRKAVEMQNLGPNSVFCTVDGQAPLATGVLGRRLDANGGTWALDVGRAMAVKCIAATAAQVTGACIQLTELR